MSTISSDLTAEHRQADELFARAEQSMADGDWEQAESLFRRFMRSTFEHFDREEAVLFPAFEQAIGHNAGPTQMMRIEHAEIRSLFDRVSAAITLRDGENSLGLAETLLIVIQQHNVKEEQVLYPMSDRMLGAQRDTLALQMRQLHGGS